MQITIDCRYVTISELIWRFVRFDLAARKEIELGHFLIRSK